MRRLPRRSAKEGRIKAVDLVEESRPNGRRFCPLSCDRMKETRRVPTLRRYFANPVLLFASISQKLCRPGAQENGLAHADDCYRRVILTAERRQLRAQVAGDKKGPFCRRGFNACATARIKI